MKLIIDHRSLHFLADVNNVLVKLNVSMVEIKLVEPFLP